jgi:Amt family ammonium transporter
MPGTESAITGLLYGGGLSLLGVQALGAASVAAWTIGTSFVLFGILKKTVGLRVTEQEETIGLDIHEHNTQAYADFMVK